MTGTTIIWQPRNELLYKLSYKILLSGNLRINWYKHWYKPCYTVPLSGNLRIKTGLKHVTQYHGDKYLILSTPHSTRIRKTVPCCYNNCWRILSTVLRRAYLCPKLLHGPISYCDPYQMEQLFNATLTSLVTWEKVRVQHPSLIFNT